jgi:type IV secretory pathway protease TraF
MMGSIGLKSARNVRGTIRPVVAVLAVLMLVIGAMAAFMARLGEEIVRVTEQVTVGGTTVTITVTAPLQNHLIGFWVLERLLLQLTGLQQNVG